MCTLQIEEKDWICSVYEFMNNSQKNFIINFENRADFAVYCTNSLSFAFMSRNALPTSGPNFWHRHLLFTYWTRYLKLVRLLSALGSKKLIGYYFNTFKYILIKVICREYITYVPSELTLDFDYL